MRRAGETLTAARAVAVGSLSVDVQPVDVLVGICAVTMEVGAGKTLNAAQTIAAGFGRAGVELAHVCSHDSSASQSNDSSVSNVIM